MASRKFRITLNGVVHEVEVEEVSQSAAPAVKPVVQEAPAPVQSSPVQSAPVQKAAPAPAAGGETVSAPLPGKILDVRVKPGQSVKAGDIMVILEAMKMENEIVAPHDGVVDAVVVSTGANVATGDALVTLK